MRRLVLASASPRRRALLEALGLSLDVIPSSAEEHFDGAPEAMVVSNAQLKRDEVAARLDSPALVIAADTLVFLDGQPLGKPTNLDEAREMVRKLSGNTHDVLTGLALVDTESGRESSGFEQTAVTFRDLDPAEIDVFVETVEPVDRAGAYTVDGPGSLLVARYEGCYYNVLGLPMVRLDELLRPLGLSLFTAIDGRRAQYL